MNRHLRKAALVTAAVTAGLLMTACQNGTSNSGSSGQSPKSSSSDHKSVSKTTGTSKHTKSAGTAAQNTSSSQQGVSGTFAGGTVSYLAPGKYIVSVPGRTDQAFFTADDTRIHGAGKICASGQCTADQLETATKKAAVTADVTLKNGIATVVRERVGTGTGTGTKGVNGTWLGQVSYLAPGKFTVSGPKGAEQAFFVSDGTVIKGAGTICGSPSSLSTCTLDQLEAAAKKGLDAKVVIANGIATSVTEDH